MMQIELLAVLQFALLAAIVVAPVWFAATGRWQATLFFVMVLLVYEGALRKWFFTDLQGSIYFLKDALLLIAFFGFLAGRRRAGAHEPLLKGLTALLTLSFWFFLLEIANPNSPSFLIGILGFKSYLLYALLLFIVPYAFESVADLDRKLKGYMLIMIPVVLLGFVQFALPVDHVLNTYVKRDEAAEILVANFGQAGTQVRTTGTFSYISGFCTFLIAMFYVSLAHVLTRDANWYRNIVPFALLAASCAVMFTTGSRSVVVCTIGVLPIVLLLCIRAKLISGSLVVRLTMASAVIVAATMFLAGDAVDAFNARASNADSAVDRIFSPVKQAIEAFEVTPVFGLGIGVTHNATSRIMGISDFTQSWWLQGKFFEDETARVLQEVGIVGFILVYAVRFALFGWAVAMTTRLRTRRFKMLSACIAGFFIAHVPSPVINNPTANFYLWFASGLLFAMYRLDYTRTFDRLVMLPRTRSANAVLTDQTPGTFPDSRRAS
jgi:hypothetical protein